jgi:hypothetical protein
MSISDYLKLLRDTPLPSILVIGGIIFLLLSVLQKAGTSVETKPGWERFSILIGVILLISGIGLYLVPPTSPLPSSAATQSPSPIDSISGKWVGTAKSGDFEFDATFIIENSCSVGTVCGTFDFPKISCSGTLTIIKVNGNLFEFQANDRTSGCLIAPEIQDSLQLLPDGTLLYVSKGNSSTETRGILHKEK